MVHARPAVDGDRGAVPSAAPAMVVLLMPEPVAARVASNIRGGWRAVGDDCGVTAHSAAIPTASELGRGRRCLGQQGDGGRSGRRKVLRSLAVAAS